MSALGETINIMTLGGLALAVGILVDDATVEIENINRNLDQGKEIIQAILDGASQIAVPALVSTLSICIVFVPMFFLTGVAQVSLRAAGRGRRFRDAGVVPAFAHAGADHGAVSARRADRRGAQGAHPNNPAIRWCGCNRNSKRDSSASGTAITACSQRPSGTGGFSSSVSLASAFFLLRYCRSWERIFSRAWTAANSSCICARPRERGSRIRRRFATASRTKSGRRSPPAELGTHSSTTLGCPTAASICSYSNSAPIGPGDADIQVELAVRPSPDGGIRPRPPRQARPRFSGRHILLNCRSDIVSQILNFGLPAPIDVQDRGPRSGGEP